MKYRPNRNEPKYVYEFNAITGECICRFAPYPPTTGRSKNSARGKMLRQVRRIEKINGAVAH